MTSCNRDRVLVDQSTRFKGDGKLTFDRLTDVYHSGTRHEEDQPCHLVVLEPNICGDRCVREYGNPCQYFCPAAVYEMVTEKGRAETENQFRRIASTARPATSPIPTRSSIGFRPKAAAARTTKECRPRAVAPRD